MAKEIQVTCRFCKKKIDKDSALKDGNLIYYCNEECRKKQANKTKYAPPKTKQDGTNNPRRKLTDYVLSLYLEQHIDKHKIPWEQITAQLRNIMKDHKDWTYEQIKYVLYYMKNIAQVNLFAEESKGSVFTLVPFYFQEAKQFALDCQKIRNSVKDFEINDEVIVIKKKEKVVKDYIDMENLI